MTMPAANNNGMTPPTPDDAAAINIVYANYVKFATQLGAIMTLLTNMPLEHMLAACKRYQTTSMFLAPADANPAQLAAQSAAYRNDQRVIESALELQRIIVAVHQGG